MAAKLAYMALHSNHTGPLFMFRNGQCLARVRFVSALRETLRSSGIDTSLYTGHSFRIGVAMTVALHGLQDSLFQTLGCWRSSTYTLYIQTPPLTLVAVSSMLSVCNN